MDCYVTKGDGEMDCKYNPICQVKVLQTQRGDTPFSFMSNGQYKRSELLDVIQDVYNDPNVTLPERMPNVYNIRYDEDREYVIPRSALSLPYGMLKHPSCTSKMKGKKRR
jgi:hypothetical protein